MINKLITMIMLLGAVNNITIASDANTPINSDTHVQTTSHLRSALPKVVIKYQDPITGKKYKITIDDEMAEHIAGDKYYLNNGYIKCLQYGDRILDFYTYGNNDNLSLYDAFPELIASIMPQLPPLAPTKEIVLKLYTKKGDIYHEDINGCKQIGPGDLENTEIVGCMHPDILSSLASSSFIDELQKSADLLQLVLIKLISAVNTLEGKNMSDLSIQSKFRNNPHETCRAIKTADEKTLFSLLMNTEYFKVVVKFNQPESEDLEIGEPESETYMKTRYPDREQQGELYKVVLDVLLDALKQFQTHVNKERTSARYRNRNRHHGFQTNMLINPGTIEADLQVIKHNPELFDPRCLKELIRGLGHLNNAIDVVQELLQAAQTAYPFYNFNFN